MSCFHESLLPIKPVDWGYIKTGFPQTFDNWIQGLLKDFQGQQQQFSRIYFKAQPPVPPLLAVISSHKNCIVTRF